MFSEKSATLTKITAKNGSRLAPNVFLIQTSGNETQLIDMTTENHGCVTTLSSLIDSGYSKFFAIQIRDLSLSEDAFFMFDARDREIWGETHMSANIHIKLPSFEPVFTGYSSNWSNGRRIICIPASHTFSPSDLDSLTT